MRKDYLQIGIERALAGGLDPKKLEKVGNHRISLYIEFWEALEKIEKWPRTPSRFYKEEREVSGSEYHFLHAALDSAKGGDTGGRYLEKILK